jgi:hypothetical protein
LKPICPWRQLLEFKETKTSQRSRRQRLLVPLADSTADLSEKTVAMYAGAVMADTRDTRNLAKSRLYTEVASAVYRAYRIGRYIRSEVKRHLQGHGIMLHANNFEIQVI